ncbi:rubrerythrin [Anaerotalea alkaliphila]|uniref:Rubrerythrin family protein n=1 Tax=Anaerotalea alkaliphila TaxID=2662126 RepID=A0A7X5KLR9_9FIRM|nr:rubrerythrin family protein [Anaerotalea alkaliphila]NDL67111.1 rubrerythrin family protein [Anaerotalea alkaliphila]
MQLKGTRTASNLMQAYLGEAQAMNRYTLYASAAKKEGYAQIAEIFTQTADQERAHAKRFLRFLAEDHNGEEVALEGASYPVAFGDTLFNLRSAAQGEGEEGLTLYPGFAGVAEAEGFKEIAYLFQQVAVIEESHGARFAALAGNLEEGRVFSKEQPVEWVCRVCGYIYTGENAPGLCPVCLHPQAHFEVQARNY